jgi:hypothetical protein
LPALMRAELFRRPLPEPDPLPASAVLAIEKRGLAQSRSTVSLLEKACQHV